jgi:hypothetical protein
MQVTTEAVTAHFDKFDPSIMTAEFNSSSLSGGLDPLEPLYAAIADLIVMARARCIMYSKGGFARLATWWSGTTCTKSAEVRTRVFNQAASACCSAQFNHDLISPLHALCDCSCAYHRQLMVRWQHLQEGGV